MTRRRGGSRRPCVRRAPWRTGSCRFRRQLRGFRAFPKRRQATLRGCSVSRMVRGGAAFAADDGRRRAESTRNSELGMRKISRRGALFLCLFFSLFLCCPFSPSFRVLRPFQRRTRNAERGESRAEPLSSSVSF